MTHQSDQPMSESVLGVEDQMMLDAVLIRHLKSRIEKLEAALRETRRFVEKDPTALSARALHLRIISALALPGAADERPVKRPPICEGCENNRSDSPSKLYPDCQAYREHQA